MDPHGLRPALGLVFTSLVCEVSDKFLLLGIDGDHRLAGVLELSRPLTDVLELRVAIRMLLALCGLARRLKAVSEFREQLRNLRVADLVALRVEFLRQFPCALARPTQRGGRVPPACRLNEGLQCLEDLGVRFGEELSPAP